MMLNEWPGRRRGRPSVVDTLPDDVIAQVVDARVSGSHSVSSMIEWLKSEGYENVSPSALINWFQTRGHSAGMGKS